jgi:hypothetical protein
MEAMRIPGFAAEAALYPSSCAYRASVEHVAAETGLVVPAAFWGILKRDHCTHSCCWTEGPGCGRRQLSAILWDIPWGQSWSWWCQNTAGPAEVGGRLPDRCPQTWFNQWGEWNVPDPSCDTFCEVGGW